MSEAAGAQVRDLARAFRDQVKRALALDLDGSVESLAFVDHYLRTVRESGGDELHGVVAAGAGAYLGDLIAREVGATWLGDGKDPRTLRLLLRPLFLYLAPVDVALDVLGDGQSPVDDLDAGFHGNPRLAGDEAAKEGEDALPDHEWLSERLAEIPPLPEDQYYSLTARYETLLLLLQLLATRHLALGRTPSEQGLMDYATVLVHDA